jgi:hypothetical protein
MVWSHANTNEGSVRECSADEYYESEVVKVEVFTIALPS